MSITTRKRPRKSKLVPREVESDDNKIITISQSQSKSMAGLSEKKINWKPLRRPIPSMLSYTSNTESNHNMDKSRNISMENNYTEDFESLIDGTITKNNHKTSPRKFSVTVAVEECDSSKMDLIKKEDNAQECLDATGHILERSSILETTNKILEDSTDIADKMLSIEVKNCLGYRQRYIPSPIEKKIQAVFEKWNEWQKLNNIRFRSAPLLYKCYICERSWWHYYDFREHLNCHDDFKLDMEEYTVYEANVIAYSNLQEINVVKHFYTEGDCPKCGNVFSIHKQINRIKDCFYYCLKCNKQFTYCSELKEHDYIYHNICEINDKLTSSKCKVWEICEVCKNIFLDEEKYDHHMITVHNVRSDIVMPSIHKICKHCEVSYVCDWMHICPKNAYSGSICSHCYRMSSLNCGVHFDENGKRKCIICKVCKCNISIPCMEADHLLTHTDKFIKVKVCMLCDDFKVFTDSAAATNHEKYEHINKMNFETKHHITLYSIIIPKSCLPSQVLMYEIPISDEKPVADKKSVAAEISVPTGANHSDQDEKQFVSAPELKIKQEVLDEFQYDTGYEPNIVIKKEFEYEEHPVIPNNYAIKIQSNENVTNGMFSIKIEHLVKQEMEEEYEDDIIKLDYGNSQSVQDSLLDTIQNPFSDNIEDDIQEDDSKLPRMRIPKIYKCSKCHFEGYHREYRIHEKNCSRFSYQKGPFKCTKCVSKFDTFLKYVLHLTVHGLKTNSCPECFREFNSCSELITHISMHVESTYATLNLFTVSKKSGSICFKCKICLEKVERINFFTHWESHLTLVERKQLEKVNEVDRTTNPGGTIDDNLLQEILRRLQTYPYGRNNKPACLLCHRVFDRRNDCKRHLVEHLLNHALCKRSPEDGLLKCQICGNGFNKSHLYKQHMRDHGNLPIYSCEFCDKTFSDSSNFTKHKKLHNENAYTCDICGKKFQAKISIERHVKLHETQKPISCEKCDKIFFLESSYKKHVRTKHDRSVRFRCYICGAKYVSLKEKWDHMWYVHKERKYKADCPLCKISYRKYSDLKRHLKNEHRSDMKFPNKKGKSKSKVYKRETVVIL